jgi:hypothetical protein
MAARKQPSRFSESTELFSRGKVWKPLPPKQYGVMQFLFLGIDLPPFDLLAHKSLQVKKAGQAEDSCG